MKITKTEFEKLIDKIVSSLNAHFNDPKVIDYNFYNNTTGVGVKMVRKGKKITIEDLALTVHNLALEMRAGFAKMDAFIIKQEEFNKKVDIRLEKIEQDIKDIKSCPTIKKELKLLAKQ